MSGTDSAAARDEAPRIAFTFDDFNVFAVPALSGTTRNRSMLDALQTHGLKAAVFVIGRNVENADTMRLLESWNDILRYPGEDGAYEAPRMDALGL